MNAERAQQIQRLLQMISHSIHGPWPVSPELDYPDLPARSLAPVESAPRSGSILPLFSTRKRLARRPAFSAIRMQCLRLLKAGEALTACEAAERLGLDPEVVQLQFSELQSLRLIEKEGARRVQGRVRPLFQLNPSHPVLELLLGPTPGREQSAAI